MVRPVTLSPARTRDAGERSTSAARWRSRRATSGGEPRGLCRATNARLALNAVPLVVVFPISASRYLGTMCWVNQTTYAGRWNDAAWTWPHWYSLRMLAYHSTMLFVRTALCVRCLRRRPADVYGQRAHATVGHVHSSPRRSCWFLVGQVARGRQNCRTGCRTILPWGTCSDPG